MTKTPETNIVFGPQLKFELPEHTGGDGWTILHGDCLRLMREMQDGVFDAVITDPPYASGGSTPAEKNKTTNQKYSSMPADKALPDFAGDQMDQRSWTNFMTDWLNEAYRLCRPGAPICLFIDWRQLPSMTDALQRSGWIWRGIAVAGRVYCLGLEGGHAPATQCRVPARRLSAHEPCQPHPCNREVPAADAGHCPDL